MKYSLFALTFLGLVSAVAKPPNIFLVLGDDMGYSDARCFGGDVDTPVLDKFAANGLRFTQMYSTGRCWPSRGVIMTGYYAQQVGMDPRRGQEWPSWSRTIAQRLKGAGYRNYHS
ncbi:MAG: sulfatase-like hydrolase/transferase, partial [Verrucomicrobiae bacterium]|nr:sulfatase-like hydrolase/transferase [Verrucomicrobiae bacterium]